MKRIAAWMLLICIALSGCDTFMEGEHLWTQVHTVPTSPDAVQNQEVANYNQLYQTLADLVVSGISQATLSVERYDRNAIERDVQVAVGAVCSQDPIAAYAVEQIDYTLGTSGGQAALVLKITYLRDQSELKKIRSVANYEEASQAICAAMVACEPGIVLLMDQYAARDIAQLVEDYALDYPELVMETPQVSVNTYPDEGRSRVVEIKFAYQTRREVLKNMQSQVENLFKSAQYFTVGYQAEMRKTMRLYTWLMETNEYTLQTSITPAYSLLQYGTGDSRAFATVFAALCRRMDLQCMTVPGTKDGASWWWNLICVDGAYYHLDLLQSHANGEFTLCTDSQMSGYVWDYNAYPASPDQIPEPTVPPTTEVEK